jgi:asparagine synthase (glutamine-hydrolysing)
VRCALAGRLLEQDDLAAAFARDGIAALGGLRGSFAVALWDESAGRGLLAVDQLGAGALFFAEIGGTLHFATELEDLLRLLPRRPSPERAAVVHWLADGFLERGQTLYEGVRRVPGGHALELGPEGWRETCYWAPRYGAPAHVGPGEAVETVRTGLRRAVERRAVGGGPAGVLLSGGLDSTSIAALLRDVEPAQEPPQSFSAVFPGLPTVDESELVAEVTARLSLEGRRIALSGGSMLAGALAYQERWGAPTISPNLAFQSPLLTAAAQTGVEVLFDGEGGDELFGCPAYLLADLVRRGRPRSAWGLAGRFPALGARPDPGRVRRYFGEFGLKGAAPHAVHALARRVRGASHYAPVWLTKESAALESSTRDPWAWKRVDAPLWWAERADELTAQRERLGAHDLLRRRNASFGLEGAHPLLDDSDLVELVLALPPVLSFDPSLDRPLLRASMEGALPESVRLRPRKSTFDALFVQTLDTTDRPHVTRLLTAPDAEVRSYVRADVVGERLLAAPRERRGGAWAWALWRLATAECWLRAQADPELPRRALDTWDLEPVGAAPA